MTMPARRLTSLVAILAMMVSVLVAAAAPSQAQTSEDYSILVFSKTAGFRHGSIEAGIGAIEQLGADNDVTVDVTEDATAFTEENLANYAAVVWLSTTGDVLNADQQTAFENYIQSGGGYAGVHAASDTEYDWSWYGDLVGAYFDSHPSQQTATVVTEDHAHPSTDHLATRWSRFDEWYNYRENPRNDVHVLQSLDESTYDAGGGAMGIDHPITWCQEYEGGRSWYTGLGHTDASYSDPEFLDLVWNGIETAAGAIPSDCTATDWDSYQKITLDDNTSNPMELDVADDGRVFYIDRNGDVRIIATDGSITTAGTLDVYTGQEFGLIGMELDPNFSDNNWIYLTYSPDDGVAHDLVSRFTMDGDTLDLASEELVLEITTQRDQCCHAGGELEFDNAGDLYIATGDNSNPFASSGYAPIDERPGREPWDAQRTSANSNVLNGKILRITPSDAGGYTVPDGNLFDEADDTEDLTRPEIYAMGFRNPFRIGTDPLTGKLLVADYGPDAGSANPNRGPDGRVEWNIVDEPGNYGWPYCVADNTPYIDYDFATSTSGDAFDCENGPVNDSPNNTGLTQLPSAIGAEQWYGKSSTGTPEIGTGGAPMAGDVYRYDDTIDSEAQWPAYWDGKAVFGEWNRTVNGMFSFQVDDDVDQAEKINPMFPGDTFRRLMAFDWGPDGALYFVEWGSGFGGNNSDSGIYRMEYVGSDRSPVARLSADVTNGPTPLTVNFSADGSFDPDGGPVTYAWDFDGDGTTDATDFEPSFTYTDAGNFDVQLTVTDDEGETASSIITITAGNTAPEIEVVSPPNGGFFSFGDTIAYEVNVTDPEDGTVDCDDVITQPALGHDQHAHGYEQYTGCSGEFPLPGDEGHVGANIFGVVTFTYTDGGGDDGAGPITTQEVIELRLRHTEAEYFAETGRTADGVGGGDPGVQVEDTSDVGGGSNIGFIEDGDWWSLDPADLVGINSVDFRVASAGAGGEIEIHTDAPDGPIVGTATVPVTDGWQTWETVSVELDDVTSDAVYFVAQDPDDGLGSLFNVNWMEFDGPGASANRAPQVTASATPTEGQAPLPVDFTASATDPEDDSPLTYDWTFGDGAIASGADVSHTYEAAGDFTAEVTVSDPAGASSSAAIAIAVDSADAGQCFAGRSDDFLGDDLDRDRWTVVRENQKLRVEDSNLVLPLTATDIYGTNNTDTPNIVVQPLPDGAVNITTELTLEAYEAYEQAGLILYSDDDNYIKFVLEGRDTNTENPAARVIQFVEEAGGSPDETNTANLGVDYPDTVQLQLRIDGDGIAQGYYSPDGSDWTAADATGSVVDWTEPQVGVFALAGNGKSEMEEASFDWFQVSPDDTIGEVGPDDEFDKTILDLCRWSDSVRLDPAAYTVADGELTIQTGDGDIYTTPNGTPTNFILQPQPSQDWTVETKMDTSNLVEQYQQAGLLVHVDDDNYVKFDHVVDNAVGSPVTARLELRSEVNGSIVTPQPNVNDVAPGDLWLRLSKAGDTFNGEYSTDGEIWTSMGDGVDNALAASGGSVGIFTVGTNQAEPVPVSFDYFHLLGDDPGDTEAPAVESTLLGAFTGEFNPAVGSDLTGQAELTITSEQSTISVDVTGLEPDGDFSGHLHVGTCAAVQGHYMDDPDGPAMPPNELWLTDDPSDPLAGFTADSSGAATVSGTAAWTATSTAQAIMIHGGAQGVPRGCATVDTSANPVDVVLDAVDDGDGQVYVEYKLDGASDWSEYTSSVTVSEPGDHIIEYRASDTAGNISEVGTTSFTIAEEDGEPLTLDVTVDPVDPDGRDGWYVSPVTVTATTNDDAATLEFNVDGAGWVADDDGSLVLEADGVHTVDVRAALDDEVTDAQSVEVNLDTAAPDLIVEGIADRDQFAAGSDDEVTWSAEDTTSGLRIIRVRLDGEIIDRDLPNGGPFLPGSAEPGDHELFVRAHDRAGNFVTVRHDFTVTAAPDTTKPIVTIEGIDDGNTYGDSRVLSIVASASDSDSDIDRLRVKLDGKRIYQGGSPWEFALPLWDLDLGEHQLKVIAWDTAGNRKAVTLGFTVGTSITDMLINVDRFHDGGFMTDKEARKVTKHVERAERHLDNGNTGKARKELQDARDDARDVANLDVRRLLERDLTELIRDMDGNGSAPDTTEDALANTNPEKLVPTPSFLQDDDA